MTDLDNNVQEQGNNDELLLKSGFSKEEITAIRAQATQKIEADRQEAHLKVQQTLFDEVYTKLLNDPSMAPMKDVLESELVSNPKYKAMGSAGVEVLLGMAKKEVELAKYKNSTSDAGVKVDSLGGSSNAASNQGNAGDSAMLEGSTTLIDFNKVTLEGLSPAKKDFVLLQRQRQNKI